jgi:hypothetical protein
MASRKHPFTGQLLKPIHLAEAKSRGLRAALALPLSDDDLLAHIQDELSARWPEFDEFFGLSSDAADIWEQRAKALNRREFGIEPDDPRWWERLTLGMCSRYVPGFSIKLPNQRKRGAPVEWTTTRLAQLFADVECRRKKTGMSIRAICMWLPNSKAYGKRWHKYGAEALRKAYLEAAKCRRHLLFELELCGPDALIPASRTDRIEAAIDRHALKIPG